MKFLKHKCRLDRINIHTNKGHTASHITVNNQLKFWACRLGRLTRAHISISVLMPFRFSLILTKRREENGFKKSLERGNGCDVDGESRCHSLLLITLSWFLFSFEKNWLTTIQIGICFHKTHRMNRIHSDFVAVP